MVNLSKCKFWLKEYAQAVLVGSVVLLALLALATTVHHALMLFGIGALTGITMYTLWRLL